MADEKEVENVENTLEKPASEEKLDRSEQDKKDRQAVQVKKCYYNFNICCWFLQNRNE